MKLNKSTLWSLLLMVLIAAIYRVIPGRPYGFAPQIGMALFSGAIFRNKILAFGLPLLSMFISDVLYQLLYSRGLSAIPGFYEGQWLNYLVFASVVLVGFFMKKINTRRVIGYSVAAATWFFILSNFVVWATGTGLTASKTVGTLISTYIAAIPFYGWSVLATVLFASILFGLHYQFGRRPSTAMQAMAD